MGDAVVVAEHPVLSMLERLSAGRIAQVGENGLMGSTANTILQNGAWAIRATETDPIQALAIGAAMRTANTGDAQGNRTAIHVPEKTK